MDWTRRTAQILGRFQPWHQGHTELFKRALREVGQVVILLRTTEKDENNPYSIEERTEFIKEALKDFDQNLFHIMPVPNITQVAYGRDVGYSFQCYRMDMNVESISATNIRNETNL